MRITTAWDHDGVQSDSSHAVIEAIKPLGINLKHSQLISWNTVYEVALTQTKSQAQAEKINYHWFSPETLRKSSPYHLNLLLMKFLRRLGIGVVTITTRTPECRQSTLDWMKQYTPWASPKDFFIRPPHSKLSGDDFKILQAKKLRVNIFVEDNSATAVALSQIGIYVILPTRPWNQSFDASSYPNIKRVYNSLSLALVIFTEILDLRAS